MRFRNIEPRKPERCFSHSSVKYTAESGDTLYGIASKFGISLRTLKSYNRHIWRPPYIVPGDVLCIPKQHTFCSFISPTKNTPKGSYAILTSLNGITCLANLPPIKSLGEDYINYFCYAVSEYGYDYAVLSHISETPSIWLGEITQRDLEPQTKILISANKSVDKEDDQDDHPKPPGDLILFEST